MAKKGYTEEQIIAALQTGGSRREDGRDLPQVGNQPSNFL